MISRGLPGCPCGAGLVEPLCLEDACHVPGEYGERAYAEYSERVRFSELQSERGTLGAAKRAQLAQLRAMTEDERLQRVAGRHARGDRNALLGLRPGDAGRVQALAADVPF